MSSTSSNSQLLTPELVTKLTAAAMGYCASQDRIDEREKRINDLDKKIIISQQQQAEARQQQVEARQQQVEARQQKVEATQLLTAAKIVIARCDANSDINLVKMFYGIFGLKFAETDPVEPIISKFSLKDSIVFEEKCYKIKSMQPVVKFLEAHAECKKCDFRGFRGEVNDLSTLSTHIVKATSNVASIGLSSKIPEEGKTSLTAACVIKPTVKVVYFS